MTAPIPTSDASEEKKAVEEIHDDASGQFARGLKSSDNNGVASAKPRVITGSDDAAEHKTPPGKKPAGTDWDINSDDRKPDEPEFNG